VVTTLEKRKKERKNNKEVTFLAFLEMSKTMLLLKEELSYISVRFAVKLAIILQFMQ
jgi:hypothetical protein